MRDIDPQIEELAASLLNGNINAVADEIAACTPAHAAELAIGIALYVPTSDVEVLQRALGRRAEKESR